MANTNHEVFARHQRRMLVTLWATYASYYLCRVNMAAVQSKIIDEGDFTRDQFGIVLGALTAAYGLGQLINGQLSDRFGGRVIASIGMFGSAAMNVLFGFSGYQLWAMGAIWTVNGYFQSMGWSACVKTLANWYPLARRGRVSGVFCLSYKVGNVITWLLVGWLAVRFGWRWGFWCPAALLAAMGVWSALGLRGSPQEAGLPPVEAFTEREPVTEYEQKDEHLGYAFTIRQSLGNPRVWLLGIAGLLLAIPSYGFLFWLPTYLGDRGDNRSLWQAAAMSVFFPLGGCLGSLVVGWASDTLFAARRAPGIVIAMLLGGLAIFVLPYADGASPVWCAVHIALIAFFVMGAHAHIVSSSAMDFASRKAAASATGFIDALGYVGATITNVVTGYLAGNSNWHAAFWIWGSCACAAALLMATLWHYVPAKGSYE